MDYDALYKLTHGLYILGAVDENGRLVGSVIDAVMQVANKPWVIAVSCGNNSFTKSVIDKKGEFSLSVIGKKINPFVIANFGFQSSRDVDKWDNVDYCIIDKLPYLNENLANFRCKVLQKIVFESNTLFVAEVSNCANNAEDEPLTYLDYRSYFKNDVIQSFKEAKKQSVDRKETELKNEAEPENLSANNEKKLPERPAEGKKWVCTVCNYVYDEEVPFEDLPDDWTCPVCGVDKSFFVLQ